MAEEINVKVHKSNKSEIGGEMKALCKAILTQAFQDYQICMNRCNRNSVNFVEKMRDRKMLIQELNRFFASEWCVDLMNEAFGTENGETLAYNVRKAFKKLYEKSQFKKQLEDYEKRNGSLIKFLKKDTEWMRE